MQVKVLFMMLMELCRRTAGLQHPLPISQVGSSNVQVRLHYIDGNYTVLPEVVEASLGPHMQVTSYGSTYFKFIIFVKQTKDWCSDISSALCYSLVDLLWCYIIRLENGLTTVFLHEDSQSVVFVWFSLFFLPPLLKQNKKCRICPVLEVRMLLVFFYVN
jgi:hypothetical protein